jgi:hypothetical protein
LKHLGYRIWRKRDTATGLDVVATFDGIPIYPEFEKHYSCRLIKPCFSPDGVIAFSLKRGNPHAADLNELLQKIEESSDLDGNQAITIGRDKKPLDSGILATNFTKSISEIERLLEKNIHCWDIIRLLFYANKSKICQKLSLESNVYEQILDCGIIGTYILSPYLFENGILRIRNSIFIEEYLNVILEEIYEKNFKPIVSSKLITDIEVKSDIHIHNLADAPLLDEAFYRYAGDLERHPNVSWLRDFDVYSYESRPWYPFL